MLDLHNNSFFYFVQMLKKNTFHFVSYWLTVSEVIRTLLYTKIHGWVLTGIKTHSWMWDLLEYMAFNKQLIDAPIREKTK